jgi:argonaute-like protein implicated in RNA metabolism and viral defense
MKDRSVYSQIKSKLLANGIPSQMVAIENVNNAKSRQYILENVALASYAKVGGTPWTVSTTTSENNLILGISRAQDYLKKYLVGFVTLFSNDGDFLFMNSKAPVVT